MSVYVGLLVSYKREGPLDASAPLSPRKNSVVDLSALAS